MSCAAPLELTVSVHKNSGDFEIFSQGDLIATGKVFELETTEAEKSTYDYSELRREAEHGDDLEKMPMLHDDIYKELRLRSYHCDSLFKGINSISHTGKQ